MKKLGILIAIFALAAPVSANPFKLSDRMVGSWVSERNCATDTGSIFGKLNSQGVGEYGTLETNGTWTIEGNRVTVRVTHEMRNDRMVRKNPAEVHTFSVVAMSKFDGIGSRARFKASDGSILIAQRCPLPEGW